MAREQKLEVCVLNIALTRQQGSAPKADDYHKLLRAAFKAKHLARLRGDRRGLLVQVDQHAAHGRVAGVVATFTDFDAGDSWLDTQSGAAATEDELEKINIPERLRPRHRRYNFLFDLARHKLVLETRSEPTTGKDRPKLTPGSAAAMFEDFFQAASITQAFGPVGVTVLPHQEGIEAIINWRHAEKIELKISPPNPDDEDLEELIEERMSTMNVARWDQGLRASGESKLAPDDELKATMRVAARNGFVSVVGHEQGQRLEMSTKNVPLLVDTWYQPATELHLNAFQRVAEEAIDVATVKRPAVKGRKKQRRRKGKH